LHIVTAAHCVFDQADSAVPADKLIVRAGVSDVFAPRSSDAVQDREVAGYRTHPGYQPLLRPSVDDVAVLTLAEPLNLDGVTTAAIALPSPLQALAGGQVGLAGFGVTDGAATEATDLTLNGLTQTFLEPRACASSANPGGAALVCAATDAASPCHGDSGSALYTTAQPPVLIGVASFIDSKDCIAGSKTWYANVAAPEVLQFIRGDDNPPIASRLQQDPRLRWTTRRVGAPLVCTAGVWSDGPTYVLTLTNETGKVVRTATTSSTTYILRKTDVGHQIICRVNATNAGGTGVAVVGPSPRILPAKVRKR
jgi:hypothetical protein